MPIGVPESKALFDILIINDINYAQIITKKYETNKKKKNAGGKTVEHRKQNIQLISMVVLHND